MFRRGLSLFVLVFSLLFVQQGGFAHELSHATRSSQGDKQLPHSKACEQCAAYSQVGTGAVSQPLPFLLPEWRADTLVFPDVAPAPRHFPSRLSRAPPVLA